MSHAVTLWIPDLLNHLRVKEAQSALKVLSLPGLQTLLAKADRFAVKPQNFYEQASFLFHQPSCLSIAATKAGVEIKDYDESLFWLSVDPVQMVPDRDTLVLIPGNTLQITDDESKSLITAFNEHFAEDKVELIWATATRWYLSIKQPVDIQTTYIEKLAYQSVNEHYPKGNASQYWRQLINETQMLFYTHPINEKRREKGWPEINSVWIWGEGKIDSSQVLRRTDAAIYSQNVYLSGMAKQTGSLSFSEPANYQAWLKQIQSNNDLKINKHFISLNSTSDDLDSLQLEDWITLLKQLEVDWFAPLLNAVKSGNIDSLLLDLGQTYRSHIKPSNLKRFWRLKKSLSQV
ncbi:hypothetical protein [Thiomicrorhabdus sp. Milos-T2]|uniref:hypothetical protein n=1 Tax=Thiomicrorhabdus sp. Milos-T2 TaxID=90814 RepID=UPI000AE7B7CD|nr:hypothetical protein [Thiomicrorhabdus sp. Milos-T2]